MSMNKDIRKILRESNIDPDAVLESEQTAEQHVEAAILGALEEIEEELT
jgi:hypothetical protein